MNGTVMFSKAWQCTVRKGKVWITNDTPLIIRLDINERKYH